MNCDIIKDLLPLYIDECCSEESAKLVSAHIERCSECRKVFESMRRSYVTHPTEKKEVCLRRISSWKASWLQSAMLFISFTIMTFGVILEGSTPTGTTNGLWAVGLIIPATGYLLSLSNWFFVRIYKTRKSFSDGSCIATLAITVLGYVWAFVHYSGEITLSPHLVWIGVVLCVGSSVLSKVLSNQYALLLGRE